MSKQEDTFPIDPALRLQPGQEKLTPAQEAEARRFADERIQAQLSIEPVNEREVEYWLRQAYQAAGLPAPQHILWLDSPLQLAWLLSPKKAWKEPRMERSVGASVRASMRRGVRDSVRDSLKASLRPSARRDVRASVEAREVDSLKARVEASLQPGARASGEAGVRAKVEASVEALLWASVGAKVRASVQIVGARVQANVLRSVYVVLKTNMWTSVQNRVQRDSVRAYDDAPLLACYRFFDAYLGPNNLHALTHFNELVSGYWLGNEVALIVRRPKVLTRDAQGRLHHATGKCMEYHDGWGFYAWHGVSVPEKVIVDPEALTREDYLSERNIEVRRVMMERMGERFVPNMGGCAIDEGPRGRLYEVVLPGDPERVARYVCVQDASTPRQYFLRVPPRIKTAAEAVAWTFSITVEEYQPIRET